MTIVEIIEKAGTVAAALAAIGGVVAAVIGWANKHQTRTIKREFNEAVSSPAFQEMVDGRVDGRLSTAFASSKDIENAWRRDFEVKQGEQRAEMRALGERIGQVDKRAEAAHFRIDEYLDPEAKRYFDPGEQAMTPRGPFEPDPTVIAAAVADRIIAEIRKSIERLGKDLREFQRTSGGTLEDLGRTLDGIDEKFQTFERRMSSYERKTDAKIARIEREIGVLKEKK